VSKERQRGECKEVRLFVPHTDRMKTTIKIVILLIMFALMTADEKIQAQITITVIGSWSQTIDALDLQAGAGSDLIDTYESALDAVEIDIANAKLLNWRVDVRKDDTLWHSDFSLYVRRTSSGAGDGSISGGESYQVVSDTDQSFFSGSNDRKDIYVQLKLSGVSVQILPDTYTTTVHYTVVETG